MNIWQSTFRRVALCRLNSVTTNIFSSNRNWLLLHSHSIWFKIAPGAYKACCNTIKTTIQHKMQYFKLLSAFLASLLSSLRDMPTTSFNGYCSRTWISHSSYLQLFCTSLPTLVCLSVLDSSWAKIIIQWVTFRDVPTAVFAAVVLNEPENSVFSYTSVNMCIYMNKIFVFEPQRSVF